MSKIIMVTGGSRSGKSGFAEAKAASLGQDIVYVATAIPFDDEMKDRVKKHRAQRPSNWDTIESYEGIWEKITAYEKKMDVILLDCITVMVANLMFSKQMDGWDEISHTEIDSIQLEILDEIERLINTLREKNISGVIVTNELGMGIVPDNRLSRIYRDIAGKANQKVAALSDEAYLLVSGLSLKIKG